MPKKICIGLICLVFSIQMQAQLNQYLAPINPEYQEYLKTSKSKKKSARIDNQVTGYKVPYVQLPEYYSINISSSVYVPDLPAKFDLRKIKFGDKDKSFVSKVKNQGTGQNGGNCWAFSSLASIESGWMWKGVPTEPDLSEQNLAACHGYEWKYGQGGNEFFVMSYLARLYGPTDEKTDPYITTSPLCKGKFKAVAYSPDSRWIYNNNVLTKKTIMDFGGVSTNIHWDTIYYNAPKGTNAAKDTFRYTFASDSRQGPNHAVLLVGWDDDKLTKFGKGAWIAKNSWGTGWGENGYFYISYNDHHILKPASYYPEFWPTTYVDTIFNYDEIGVVTTMGFNNDTAYALAKYHTNKPRTIREIGTFLSWTNAIANIKVYSNFQDGKLSNLIGKFDGKPISCPGFYTFNVPAHIDGDFYVLVEYINPSIEKDFKYTVPIEMLSVNLKDTFANPIIESSGKQWLSKDAKTWQPLGSDINDWKADLVIHVYATNDNNAIADVSANKYEVCKGSNIEFTALDNNADNTYAWNFGPYATPQTAIGKGPHIVTISNDAPTELQYAKLVVTNSTSNQKDSLYKEFKPVNTLDIHIGLPHYIIQGDSVRITAICDADQYSWYPTTYLSNSTSKDVVFYTEKTGLHKLTVTAVQGNCAASYTANIEVKKPPVNDKPCNAILLQMGDNGPFTNEGATASFREPAPADTSCYDDNTWCDEGGVQNSVWFKVVGPDSGRLTIDTRGMDTQIAIYESTDCNDIKNEHLIAANDDYYRTAPYAAAIDTLEITPKKEYFVQVDGSAGGEIGKFYLLVSYLPLDQIKKDSIINAQKSNIAIYPNPNKGAMTLVYKSAPSEKIDVIIADIMGKKVYTNSITKGEGKIEIPVDLTNLKLNKGVYYVSVKGTNSASATKCIIQ